MKISTKNVLRFVLLSLAFTIAGSSNASAQSTTSCDPFEIYAGASTWGVLLPDYDLGTQASGDSLFYDDMDNVGSMWQARAIRRFLGTRTSLEARGFFGFATIRGLSDMGDGSFANPATGAIANVTGSRGYLESDVIQYGLDISLRDTWHTRFGGLSAGMTFSTFTLDQDFDVRYGASRLFDESLDSDFLGGKGFVGWEGFLFGRASNLDLAFGYFDVDAEYQFNGNDLAGNRNVQYSDYSATIEMWASTRTCNNFGELILSVGGMYIADMPEIVHNSGAATIANDEAATLNFVVEYIF